MTTYEYRRPSPRPVASSGVRVQVWGVQRTTHCSPGTGTGFGGHGHMPFDAAALWRRMMSSAFSIMYWRLVNDDLP